MPKPEYSIGDKVRMQRNEGRFLYYREVCQVMEIRGRGRFQKLRLQSLAPTYLDGLWMAWAKNVVPCPEEVKKIMKPGDVFKINGRNCIIVRIEDCYSVVLLETGVGLCPMRPYDKLLIKDDLREELKHVKPQDCI